MTLYSKGLDLILKVTRDESPSVHKVKTPKEERIMYPTLLTR